MPDIKVAMTLDDIGFQKGMRRSLNTARTSGKELEQMLAKTERLVQRTNQLRADRFTRQVTTLRNAGGLITGVLAGWTAAGVGLFKILDAAAERSDVVRRKMEQLGRSTEQAMKSMARTIEQTKIVEFLTLVSFGIGVALDRLAGASKVEAVGAQARAFVGLIPKTAAQVHKEEEARVAKQAAAAAQFARLNRENQINRLRREGRLGDAEFLEAKGKFLRFKSDLDPNLTPEQREKLLADRSGELFAGLDANREGRILDQGKADRAAKTRETAEAKAHRQAEAAIELQQDRLRIQELINDGLDDEAQRKAINLDFDQRAKNIRESIADLARRESFLQENERLRGSLLSGVGATDPEQQKAFIARAIGSGQAFGATRGQIFRIAPGGGLDEPAKRTADNTKELAVALRVIVDLARRGFPTRLA